MRKLLLFITLFVCHLVLAGSVTPEEALQKAQTFLSQKSPSKARRAIKRAPALTALQQDQFYIFNIADNGGFVIVSGDDRTEQIIGYSDSGNIDEQNMPENMRSFLQEYADGIKYLNEHNIQIAAAPRAIRKAPSTKARKSIQPLIVTNWNQGYPYNAQCPVFTIGTNNYNSYTGCVATAMAQVMYYNRWPDATTAEIPAYTSSRTTNGQTFEKTLQAIPAGTAIDWNNMKIYYNSSESDNTAINAISTLMLLCGQSVNMKYSPYASGANSYDVETALTAYFDYEEETVRLLEREDYSYSDWQEIIYQELKEGRPMYYSGSSADNGHAFVCDGYDEDDFYHINWGWGGSSDGYFRLRLLDPDNQGIGGSPTNSGYGMSQQVIIGIKRNDGTVTPEQTRMTANYIYERDNKQTITRDGSGNFKMNIMYSASNILRVPINFDSGLRILNSTGVAVMDIADPLVQNTQIQYGWTTSDTEAIAVSIDNSLPDGSYKMILTSRITGSGEMLADINSETVYIGFTINGNTLTITSTVEAPVYDLQFNSMRFSNDSDRKAGSAQTFLINVTNNGTDYHNHICYKIDDEQYIHYAAFVDLEAGKTADIEFGYTFSAAGTYTMHIYEYVGSGYYEIGSQTITIGAADNTPVSSELALTGLLSYKNTSSVGTISSYTLTNVLGKMVNINATVSNPSTEYDADNYIQILVYRNSPWENVGSSMQRYTIKKGESINATFSAEINTDEYYHVYLRQYKNEEWSIIAHEIVKAYPALYSWTADGSETVSAFTNGNVLTIPANAAAVDITGLTPSSVVRNSNPNCLIYTDNSSVIDGKNVVVNGQCSKLQLTDGYDFYVPSDIQAENCRYTRTMAGNCNERKGWETIVLPFDVQNVSIGGSSNWWKTSDTESDAKLFVREFSSEQNDVLNLDYATDMKAGQPYFIGAAPAFAGQELTLRGYNQYITADNGKRISGGQYKNAGSYRLQYLENIYVLNSEGNAFTGTTGNVVQPFRAYFLNIDAEASAEGKTLYLNKEGEDPTAIRAIHVESDTENVRYNLSGQRVDSGYKGVVIKNGKKLLVR